MSVAAPETKNPFPERWEVHLKIRTEGEWFSVECDICHRVLLAGEPASCGLELEGVLVRVVNQHRHKV